MTIFNHLKILDIQHIQLEDEQLEESLSNNFSKEDIQSKIDSSELFSFFKKNEIQTVTLRSLKGSKKPFICKITTKSIELITKLSIKKTHYLFSIDSLQLKLNDRLMPHDYIIQFLDKMDHIAELVRSEKVTIDVT
ncbi:hypothetical protein DID76_04395 [Candidatus Marinamargulisbacteria bacterium SCGC AG-414-C22]|nr:hypothetical protein DID76_04395 [Candidatus Marinamargulisbacteria bacterium SCGC AG-414-C22]